MTKTPSVETDDTDRVILKLPYIGEASYECGKKLKSLIDNYNNKFGVNVQVEFTSCKVGQYFSLKRKTPLSLLSNVVYTFSCQRDAGLSYIGKTKRHLTTRVKEHLALGDSSKSEIKSHILQCGPCRAGQLGIDSFNVVKRSQNSYDVLILEALSIKNITPN